MRLDKYLADAGVGTRKEVKALIKNGLVSVEDVRTKDPGMQVAPETVSVSVNGKPVSYRRFRYYMLNKPPGVVSATEDKRERTVLELLLPEERRGVFPVGRLDKDTTGLLLLTDDGALAHRLLSPKRHVKKTYLATLDAPVGEEEQKLFAEGVRVDDGFTAMPAKLVILSKGRVSVTIEEGKFHQVKRMFAAVGRKVMSLQRISMGSLVLDEALAEGEYRELTGEELCGLEEIKNGAFGRGGMRGCGSDHPAGEKTD